MKRVGGSYVPAAGYLGERLAAMPEFHHPSLPAYELHEYAPLLDSSDMRPADWQAVADDIHAHYGAFDGFVVLHGTDTMAYTASALSFMLEHLAKPVILTGSQIPLAEVRSDARENLITSLLLAAEHRIPEVCIYLNGTLLRGNRATKVSASGFGAFASPNFPALAEVGVNVTLQQDRLRPVPTKTFQVQRLKPVQVAALRLFPGISAESLANFLQAPLQGLVLETYGAGNAPSRDEALLSVLRRAGERGVVIVNCTQCLRGRVAADYAGGSALQQAGLVSGLDMTPEAALTKLIYLLSQDLSPQAVRSRIAQDLRGEVTV